MSHSTHLPQVGTPAGPPGPQDGVLSPKASGKTPPRQGGFLPQLGPGGRAPADAGKGDKAKVRRDVRKSGDVQDLLKLKKHAYVEVQNQEASVNYYYRRYFEGKVAKQ